jgi:hypothetical protein
MEKFTTIIEFVKDTRRYKAHIRRSETNENVYSTPECSNAETALQLSQQYLVNLNPTSNNTKKPFTLPQKQVNINNSTQTCCRR